MQTRGQNDWKGILVFCIFMLALIAQTVDWSSFAYGPW